MNSVLALLLLIWSAGIGAACNNVPIERSGSYLVAPGDNGGLILAGGNSYYPIRFGNAADYTDRFCVEVLNTDAIRPKEIVLEGRQFRLWPLQTAKIRLHNGIWYDQHPERWKHPGGAFSLYTDYEKGSDDNDCMSAEQPCKTVSAAAYMLCDQFDFKGTAQNQSHAFIILAEETIDRFGLHLACRLTGAQGGVPLTISGAGATGASICPDDLSAIAAYTEGVSIHLKNLHLCSKGANGIEAGLGARVWVGPGVTFGETPNGQPISARDLESVLYTSW